MKAAIKRCICWLWQHGLISFQAGYVVLVIADATEA